MPSLGPTELIIILVIVLIIFGVGRLPEIGGAIGKSIREFRTSAKDPDADKPQEPAQPGDENRTV
jgi:sec-independent protein translocase protein TatA